MIHIVCCSDENYAFNFPVIAQSILEHHTKEEVALYLIHSPLTISTLEKIDRYAAEKNLTFSRQLLDDTIFAKLPQIAYFTTAMYYRLMIPELFPEHVSKVLYLDMDVLVEGRLDELWNKDFSGRAAAVVEDSATTHLGEYSPTRYFNSGVMLINLDYWRKNNVKEKAINFMVKHRDILRFPDQDALNVVLQNDLVYLPDKWNYHLNLDRQFLKKVLRGQIAKDKAPVIIHFNQRVKPWMYHCRHPYTSRYWQILTKTTFSEYKVQNKSFASFLFYCTPKKLRTVLWPKLVKILPQN